MLVSVGECKWVSKSVSEGLWDSVSVTECYWLLVCDSECYWLLLSVIECKWVLESVIECHWLLVIVSGIFIPEAKVLPSGEQSFDKWSLYVDVVKKCPNPLTLDIGEVKEEFKKKQDKLSTFSKYALYPYTTNRYLSPYPNTKAMWKIWPV